MPHPYEVVVFDVNETLSDITPLAGRFEEVGAPAHLAATWFAALLRDGFALSVTGREQAFSRIGAGALRSVLAAAGVEGELDEKVEAAGRWKPAAAAYEHTVHPWDIDGAVHAGMGAAWPNRRGMPYPDYFHEPQVTAVSLTGLAEQITTTV